LEEKALNINDRVNSVWQGQDTGVTDDQNLLAALVAQLNFNTEIKAAMNVKDYSTVTVLPLMWAEAPIPYLLAEDMQKNRAELAGDRGRTFEPRRCFQGPISLRC
jgi:hypothetical protein